MNKIGCGECDVSFKCYNNTVPCIRLPIKDQEIYKRIANNYKGKASWGPSSMGYIECDHCYNGWFPCNQNCCVLP